MTRTDGVPGCGHRGVEPVPSRGVGVDPLEADPWPTVRIVVVNWNSAELTIRCLESLLRTDYPPGLIEIVVVDNGSVDDSASVIARRFPGIRLVRNEQNLGFAEGCNIAMRDRGGLDMIALVNNDAVVEPQWLREMVTALLADGSAGAAAATLVLDPGFVPLDVEVREGTMTVTGVDVDGVDVTGRVLHDGGTTVGDPEWPLRVTVRIDGAARIWIPAVEGAGRATVRLRGTGPATGGVEADVEGTEPVDVRRSPGSGEWVLEVALPEARTELLNGVGTGLTEDLEGFDRGFGLPVDRAWPLDERSDPWGFCGGGVLLRVEALDEVGLFDPRFFAYYEDTDLSWRMRLAGWSTVSAPNARVHHAFGASGGSEAPWFFFLNYRNWLLTVLRNGDRGQLRRAFGRAWDFTRRSVRGNVLGRVRRGRRPSFRLALAWLRVWSAVAAAAPRILVGRWSRSAPRPGDRPVVGVRSLLQPGPDGRPTRGRR